MYSAPVIQFVTGFDLERLWRSKLGSNKVWHSGTYKMRSGGGNIYGWLSYLEKDFPRLYVLGEIFSVMRLLAQLHEKK